MEHSPYYWVFFQIGEVRRHYLIFVAVYRPGKKYCFIFGLKNVLNKLKYVKFMLRSFQSINKLAITIILCVRVCVQCSSETEINSYKHNECVKDDFKV